MENNKEVKNIADHQEQHPLEAPPLQGYPLADNPMQPPELQQLPVVERGEDMNGSPEMHQDSDEPEECCCCATCAHGCRRRFRIEPCGACSWSIAIFCIVFAYVTTCCCCCEPCRRC